MSMIRGGDDWFGPVRIEPIDRPAVADLKLVARPPGATADEIHAVGNADEPLVFLPETQLELRLSASEPLDVGPGDDQRRAAAIARAERSERRGQRISLGVEHEGVANAGAAAGLGRKRTGVEALLPDDRPA